MQYKSLSVTCTFIFVDIVLLKEATFVLVVYTKVIVGRYREALGQPYGEGERAHLY